MDFYSPLIQYSLLGKEFGEPLGPISSELFLTKRYQKHCQENDGKLTFPLLKPLATRTKNKVLDPALLNLVALVALVALRFLRACSQCALPSLEPQARPLVPLPSARQPQLQQLGAAVIPPCCNRGLPRRKVRQRRTDWLCGDVVSVQAVWGSFIVIISRYCPDLTEGLRCTFLLFSVKEQYLAIRKESPAFLVCSALHENTETDKCRKFPAIPCCQSVHVHSHMNFWDHPYNHKTCDLIQGVLVVRYKQHENKSEQVTYFKYLT